MPGKFPLAMDFAVAEVELAVQDDVPAASTLLRKKCGEFRHGDLDETGECLSLEGRLGDLHVVSDHRRRRFRNRQDLAVTIVDARAQRIGRQVVTDLADRQLGVVRVVEDLQSDESQAQGSEDNDEEAPHELQAAR